jgi:hypothetical protein
MGEDNDNEDIATLKNAWEDLKSMQGMISREDWQMGQRVMLINRAKDNIGELLYKKTGMEFYRKKDMEGENG